MTRDLASATVGIRRTAGALREVGSHKSRMARCTKVAMTSAGNGIHAVILTGSAERREMRGLCPARDDGTPCRRRRGRGAEVVRGSRGVQVAHLRGGTHGGPVWPVQQAGRGRHAAAHPQPEAHTGGPGLSSRTWPEHMLRRVPAVLPSGSMLRHGQGRAAWHELYSPGCAPEARQAC